MDRGAGLRQGGTRSLVPLSGWKRWTFISVNRSRKAQKNMGKKSKAAIVFEVHASIIIFEACDLKGTVSGKDVTRNVIVVGK